MFFNKLQLGYQGHWNNLAARQEDRTTINSQLNVTVSSGWQLNVTVSSGWQLNVTVSSGWQLNVTVSSGWQLNVTVGSKTIF